MATLEDDGMCKEKYTFANVLNISKDTASGYIRT